MTTPSEEVRVAVQALTATQKIELAGAFANKEARAKAFELIDRVERLVAANCAAVTSAASRVVADAITGEAPAGYALVPLEAFAALAALSLYVPQEQAMASFDITLNTEQTEFLKQAIGDDDCVSPIRLQFGEGHSGHGLYVSLADYPEEGSSLVVSLHVGDVSDVQSDALGATPAGSGSAAYRPEPQSVSALRAPIPGAYLIQDSRTYVGNCVLWWGPDQRGYTSNINEAGRYTREQAMRQHAARATDRPWPEADILPLARPTIDWQDLRFARAIVTREGGDRNGLRGEAIERGPEGMRPEEGRAQPFPGERHALPRLQVPVDEGLDANERDGKRQETPLADLREVPEDQRPAAPSSAQEQAGVAAQPSPHIEPTSELDRDILRVALTSFSKDPRRNLRARERAIELRAMLASPTTPTEGPAQTLTDDEIEEIAARIGSLSLHATRAHEVGDATRAMTRMILDPEGVIEFARAIESKVRASTLTDPKGAS